MNNYISDVELAGKDEFLYALWRCTDTYRDKNTALFGALCFMPTNIPEYDDIKFMFNYCKVRIHE